MKKSRKGLAEFIFFLIIGISSLVISVFVHPEKNIMSWKGELWADRAGYYIYLPATFMYKYDMKQVPQKIDEKTGFGFRIDYEKNKISTKYTYGVALLVSPFFVATHYLAKITGIPEDRGFSLLYHRMVGFAAVFYLVLGLFMLNQFLKYYFERNVRYGSLLLILAGTNLLYYSVVDPMMSHVYSFFLFSGFLLLMKKFLDERKLVFFIGISVFIALIILIRPTNILLLSAFFFWEIKSFRDFISRILLFLKPAHIISFITIVFIVFIPQFLYWKYLHGSYLFYSYTNEGFTNWDQPRLLEIWFSTLNGLFLYSPIVIVLVAGLIFMVWKKKPNGIFLTALFVFVSYIIASWYNWYYGCSFGQRSYVEYYSLLSIPLCSLLSGISYSTLKKRFVALIPWLLVGWMVLFNIRLTFNYEMCFFGSTWDWNQYCGLLNHSGIIDKKMKTFIYTNDFENNALTADNVLSLEEKRSGLQSVTIKDTDFCCKWGKQLWNFENYPKRAAVSVWILNKNETPVDAFLVCSIEKDGVGIFWQSRPLDKGLAKGKWSEVRALFDIPPADPSYFIYFYIWNQNKRDFFIDDLKVNFEN